MKRRNFFKQGAREVVKTAAQVTGARPRTVITSIRPPFAVSEDIFSTACTGCGDCIAACPFEVLFKLPEDGAPAMDLLKRGCHLCSEWPCVNACETGALEFREQHTPHPRLSKVWINTDTCLPYSGPECGACRDVCPIEGALIWSDGIRPVVEHQRCSGCALCREACIVEPKAVELAAITMTLSLAATLGEAPGKKTQTQSP